MFVLRINRLRIFDNLARKSFLGMLGDDVANVQVVSFVSTDQSELPDLNLFVQTTDEAQRRSILEKAVNETLSRRVFTSFPRVRDGHILTFGDAGFSVHHSQAIPRMLDWTLIAIKSNKQTRSLGVRMEEVLDSKHGATLERQLLHLLGTAAGGLNPGYMAAAGIARFVGEIAAGLLESKGDEVLGLFYLSLTQPEHYPHGERKIDGARGVTGNLTVDYSLFGMEPEVRVGEPVIPSLVDPPPMLELDELEAPELVRRALPILPDLEPLPVVIPPPREDDPTRPTPDPPFPEPVKIGHMVDVELFSSKTETAFYFVSDLDVDADGGPHAYHRDKSLGLDYLGNAGKPGNWWGIVCDETGQPYIQRSTDPAPGYYVSCTALFDPTKDPRDPARYVDAETIPYFVLPLNHGTDARPGDFGIIVHLQKRVSVGTIFADLGPTTHSGEASIAAAQALGIPSNPKHGGIGEGIFYLIFPGSGNRRPQSLQKIEQTSKALFEEWGGMERVALTMNPSAAKPAPIPRPDIQRISGPLEALVASRESVTMEAIKEDRPLARQVQGILIQHGLLDPPVDGLWGPVSCCGWDLFRRIVGAGTDQKITNTAAKRLLESLHQALVPVDWGTDWVGKVCKSLLDQGHWMARGAGLLNIIYVEGMNEDGSLNDDRPNAFNDLRMLVQIVEGKPKLRGAWQATTEPGRRYTEHPLNPKGAARIAFGQYKAWQVGTHRAGSASAHEALCQVRPLKVYRDYNKDYERRSDRIDEGLFGINQHWGYDFEENDIRTASAGCLVGRTKSGHREFMTLLKTDPRYQATASYKFLSTVLNGRDV